MAQYDGSIRINTLLNTSDFTSSFRRLGSSIRGLLGSLGLGLGIAGLVALGKQAIDTASDIQEVQNVVDTAFGSMSYKMEEFAKTSVKQFGISQLSAKQLGSTFMAMGKSMVGDMETASNMALNLTARAADMASFYNKSVQETSTALKSIYTGETESLKEYGVVMTQVNLQEFARQQGINKNIQAMTQAEKVQLQYAYVMEQTSLAAGDFAKTSDSWANQTRILSEQFKELLSILGSGLITVLTPVVKFLNTILTQLIAIAKQVGAILSKLFGISIPVADSGKFADDMSAAAGGADDLAEGIEAAGKAAKGALAPFDKLNVLSQDKGSGKGGAGAGGISPKDMFEEVPIDEQQLNALTEKIDKLKEVLSHLFNPFKQAWEQEGKFVIDSWKYALDEVSKLLKQIEKDFLRMWDSPETTAILSDILHIVGDIGLIIGHLARNFREAWAENDTGYKILCNIRDIFGVIIHYLRLAADATVKWADTLDFSPLLESIEGFTATLIPLFDTFGQILLFLYENILLPIASWVIEEAVPAFINLLSAALSTLNEILIVFQPLAMWLWENFLQPLGEWAGDVIISALKILTDLLIKLGNWISEHSEAIQKFISIAAPIAGIILLVANAGTILTAVVGALSAALAILTSPVTLIIAGIAALAAGFVYLYEQSEDFRNLVDGLGERVKALWEESIKPVIDNFLEMFNLLGEAILYFWEEILQPLLAWAMDTLAPLISDVCDIVFSQIENVIKMISAYIEGVIDVVKGVINILLGIATGDWERVWDGFADVVDGIWKVIKGIINGILGAIEAMVNGVIAGINTVIRAINSINVSIPSWVPGVGGNSVGFNLNEIGKANIPRLADGAVIRGGDPFMAVLGDQRHGQTNIEAPLATIRQAVREELKPQRNTGNETYVFQVDGKTFFEITRDEAQRYFKRTGMSPYPI